MNKSHKGKVRLETYGSREEELEINFKGLKRALRKVITFIFIAMCLLTMVWVYTINETVSELRASAITQPQAAAAVDLNSVMKVNGKQITCANYSMIPHVVYDNACSSDKLCEQGFSGVFCISYLHNWTETGENDKCRFDIYGSDVRTVSSEARITYTRGKCTDWKITDA